MWTLCCSQCPWRFLTLVETILHQIILQMHKCTMNNHTKVSVVAVALQVQRQIKTYGAILLSISSRRRHSKMVPQLLSFWNIRPKTVSGSDHSVLGSPNHQLLWRSASLQVSRKCDQTVVEPVCVLLWFLDTKRLHREMKPAILKELLILCLYFPRSTTECYLIPKGSWKRCAYPQQARPCKQYFKEAEK